MVLVARRRERLEQLAADLPRSLVLPADLGDPTAAAGVVRQVADAYGRLDVLVNAAGVTNVVPTAKEPLNEFRHVLDVNLVAPFRVQAQAAAALMRNTAGAASSTSRR